MAMRAGSSEVLDEMPRSKYEGKRMTLEEFEALPEEKPYLEYWDGVVLQKAVPRREHNIAAEEIGYMLSVYQRAHGDRSAPEAHIWFAGRGYRVPDIVYWAPGKHEGDNYRQLRPTLAVEIRSPGHSLVELQRKCRAMRANGVDECWLIDPERREAFVFDDHRDGTRLEPDATLQSDLLPGFSLPLHELWAALDR
jgi:Uma2 family endonuclease